MRKQFAPFILTLLAALVVFQTSMFGAGLTVLTVPWVPATPTVPHTTYPTNSTTEAKIVLGATAPSAASGDALSVVWSFGDGSPNASFATTNQYDLSTTHQYPATAAPGTAWTAVITVTDNTAGTSGTANYYVSQEANNLSSRVNVAIDSGLWYMHQTMWRANTPANGQAVNWGGWDTSGHTCNTVFDPAYGEGLAWDCYGTGVIDANNVQAFEVSGHQGTQAGGPATDPFTDDVDRGFARMMTFLAVQNSASNTYNYNPAAVNYGCSDGTSVTTTGACGGTATKVFYNASSTTCTTAPTTPCTFPFDANGNGKATYSNDGSGEPIYTGGPFVDAMVASGKPTATAPTGVAGVNGQTFATIVTDMLDYYGVCQYEYDVDPGNPVYVGYTRGADYSASGGGWLYSCQEGDDNSTSQWAAISFVSGLRGSGFGFNAAAQAYFKVVQDYNNVWVTNSETVQSTLSTGKDPWNSNGTNAAGAGMNGSFGYRGAFYYSNGWGPFAVTPSGMVQMAMDGIGRTTNTAFGDGTNAPDQRWNDAETFYADNFCNGEMAAYNNPRYYTYGMLSFTKSMLLHDPGGALTPIQYLRTQTPNVFTGDNSVPANEIDWYAALSSANGGTDACDGIAQTLVSYQDPTGFWYGHDYDQGYQGGQSPFETAWSIIMLNKTVFVSCVSNLGGRGSASGQGGAQITLSWTGQANATSYNVLRSSANGGPYTQVGTSTVTSYRDGNDGLIAGDTYYYVVQPIQGSTEVCQSNQAAIKIP
jgi:hypothetical protein